MADVLANNLQKQFDFINWPPTKPLQSLTTDTEGQLDETLCGKFLDELCKLLRNHCGRQNHIDGVAVSQLICYTDKLLGVFNHPNICVQLQAAKLLFYDEFKVVKLVTELSLGDLDAKDINNKLIFSQSLLLLECAMLNCLSSFPATEITNDNGKVLLSLLYKHLINIPHLNKSQNMVKLMVIHSVLGTVYHLLKNMSTGSCVLPDPECVKAIETVAVYPIQMLRILAKSILGTLYPYVSTIKKESMLLDDAEILSFINLLYAKPCYNKSVIVPICSYMESILAINENRIALLQCNLPKIILAVRGKQNDPVIISLFDKVVSLLTIPVQESKLDSIQEVATQSSPSCLNSDDSNVADYNHLTTSTLELFDVFLCALKHFTLYVKSILSSSVELGIFTMNSVTLMLGFIRHLVTFPSLRVKIVHFIADNSNLLSLLLKLLERWNVIADIPLFGNAMYGCLMTGSNYDRFCYELGRSGFLCWMLSFLYTGFQGDMLKFGDVGEVLGILAIIYNCAQRQQMLPALELVSTVKVLSLYAQCSNLRVKMLAKFTLCLMDFSLHDSCILDLSGEEIEYYKSQLIEAIAKGSTSHWYTYQELLQLLVYFIRNDLKHFPAFLDAIFDLLMEAVRSDDITVLREFQKVVVNLCTRSVYKQLPSIRLSQVDEKINLLCLHEEPTIKDSAIYIKLLIGNAFESTEDLLKCIEFCHQFTLHEKCCELCSNPLVVNMHQAQLFKAKSLYHWYRWEHKYLSRHYSLISRELADEKMKSCYSKAEECIRLLSRLLDNNEIDYEGSKFLDQSLLDYIHRTNKLDKLKRCLLCRTRSDLKRSHLWPKSFLKRYSTYVSSSVATRVFVSCASHSTTSKEKSPGEVTYWMLCGKCEQILSQNGEDTFFTEMFDLVCSKGDNVDRNVSYGSWLYNFAIGLLFRSFIFFDLEIEENYLVFLHCRNHLLSLPVKHVDYAENSQRSLNNAQLFYDVSQVSNPLSVFILVNPTTLNFDHPRKAMLFRALMDAGSAKMSPFYLSTGEHDCSGQYHFIVVRLRNFNFLIQLSGSTDYTPPLTSIVNPSGGLLFVPCEKNRWDCIPDGLWAAIDEIAEVIEEATLRHYAYKARSGTLKPFNSPELQQYPLSSVRLEILDNERKLHGALQESSRGVYSSFVTRFLEGAQPSLSFLPKEFQIIQKHFHTHKEYLELPQSHKILSHLTLCFTEAIITVFLASYFYSNNSDPKFYVIVVEQIHGVQVAYGVHVVGSSDHSQLEVTEPLIDMSKVSEYHKNRFQHYCTVIKRVFIYFFKIKQVESLEVLTQRVKCTRLTKSLLSVDLKCVDGCWYCNERCRHCLQPAMLGNSLRNIKGEVIKFCKVNPCYVFYTSSPDNAPALILPLPHDAPRDSELLLQITKLIGTGWSSNTVLVIQLCINTKSFDEHKGELYVLMQFRTATFQSFFDFFISKDYNPLDVLSYMKHKKSLIMKNCTLFMLMLKLIVEDSLQATTHHDLDSLLRAYYQSCANEVDDQNEAVKESGDDDDLSSLF